MFAGQILRGILTDLFFIYCKLRTYGLYFEKYVATSVLKEEVEEYE